MDGEDIIVEYEGFSLVAPGTESNGIYIYKKADQLINTIPGKLENGPVLVPNLASIGSIVNIEMKNDRKIDVQILSINGQLLHSYGFESGQNIRFFAPDEIGIYFAKIMDRPTKKSEIRKLVVY